MTSLSIQLLPKFIVIFLIYQCNAKSVSLTPPMGWLSWVRFKCATNCTKSNGSCINADLYQTMADYLVSDGYLDVGYNHVNIDDCWNTKTRNATTGQQMADPERFPKGIKGVADYVHSKGLKLGLYNDIGNFSCKGYTGIGGHYTLDANTFASWGIDMIKIDCCNASEELMYQTYPEFGAALDKSGRSIIYSCSWPNCIPGKGEDTPPDDNTTLYDVANSCNLWRNYHDIQDHQAWHRLNVISNYWRRDYNQYNDIQFLNVAGPSSQGKGWNDPDQLIIGDPGLTLPQQQTQFVLWAIFAAPLLMSNDLRTISNDSKAILVNKEVIDINQDSLGKQGGYIWMNQNESNVIWMRELYDTPKSIAIVLQNTNNYTDANITFSSYLVPSFVNGWNKTTTQYSVRDLLQHTNLGTFMVNFSVNNIPPTSVKMYKLSLQT